MQRVPPAWGLNNAYDILLRAMLLPSRPVCSWMPGLDRTYTVPTTCASSCSQLNQQTSCAREEADEDSHFQEFQVGLWLVASFDAIYFLGEVQRGLHTGTVRVKYLHPVVGKMNRFKWPLPEDVLSGYFHSD